MNHKLILLLLWFKNPNLSYKWTYWIGNCYLVEHPKLIIVPLDSQIIDQT